MPFKDRIKQLRYMRQRSKENRELLNAGKAREKLKQDLTRKMLLVARRVLQERQNYPIQPLRKYKSLLFGRCLLEKHFVIDSEWALKEATEAICRAEDELIRNTTGVKKIGIAYDLQISFLNDKVGVIWEIVKPLTK